MERRKFLASSVPFISYLSGCSARDANNSGDKTTYIEDNKTNPPCNIIDADGVVNHRKDIIKSHNIYKNRGEVYSVRGVLELGNINKINVEFFSESSKIGAASDMVYSSQENIEYRFVASFEAGSKVVDHYEIQLAAEEDGGPTMVSPEEVRVNNISWRGINSGADTSRGTLVEVENKDEQYPIYVRLNLYSKSGTLVQSEERTISDPEIGERYSLEFIYPHCDFDEISIGDTEVDVFALRE
ncbi:hypothetical protein [Natrinema saccharevitans]|uniref:hypothetical protein n=1 Tax=Natrinema saccharevitans TaxID=301967 RepID=UPI001115929B|nr:hypothetical protein [Natrinema saccharevitans]